MGSETEMVSIENTLRFLNTSACLKFKFEKKSRLQEGQYI